MIKSIKSFKFKNLIIVFILTFVISLSGCSDLFAVNNNVIDGDPSNPVLTSELQLELVGVEETVLERTDWTAVALNSIPSVVAINSFDVLGNGGSGSGVIISSNGYIVTNAHVVSEATNTLTVILNDETDTDAEDNPRYDAVLVGMDVYTDLAVLKIDVEGLTPAEFGDSSELLIASGVMAVGYPGGLDISPSATVTVGYVSATRRPIDMHSGYIVDCVQTDAAINPGNSGGALVNEYGQVIGIPTSKIAATEYEGLGFAIPSIKVQEIVNDLTLHGHITNRATLGLAGTAYDEYWADFYDVPIGIKVAEIYAETTMDSGLLVNDFIVTFGGLTANSINIINRVLQTKLPGDSVEVVINREGEEITLSVILSDFYEVYGD